ncbi:Uma2 family endonuclease [Singulisphaera rosea]
MSTVQSATNTGRALPSLVAGQRLDQATFHERYAAMPSGVLAELIDGVVFIPSPVGPEHGRAHIPLLVWLSYYEENTPGIEVLDNTSTALGPTSEPQPDAQLRILPEYGGRSRAERRFIRGVPELVVEVAHSTRYTDLGPKFDDYERAGVREYLVRALEPHEVLWHVLVDGRYTRILPDADGLYRSQVFPGLWLETQALLSHDTRRLRRVLDQGLATPEHQAFVRDLAEAKQAP